MANKYHECVDFPTPKTDIYINPVEATLCTHLSTIRDKWWVFLLTGVCVGGILIGLMVFAALESKGNRIHLKVIDPKSEGCTSCSHWNADKVYVG
jgi:hypothetical protein